MPITASKVSRFDTVVFNPETHILQVWRYREGRYPGKHEVVLSCNVANLIASDVDFEGVVRIIRTVAGLIGISEEYNLPLPWKGYRFI